MLAKLFKAFVGDKSANDIKEVQPVVDRVKEAEKSLGNLSADDLRGRSADLRERIRKHVASELTQIDQLHAQAAELPLSRLDQKEALFEQIDALELQVNEGLEEVLEEVMPEAFALVKTARRFSAEGDVEVTATELDREIAASRDLVRVEGDKAYWAKSWTAAGSEVTWDMVHYDVQLIGGVALHRARWRKCKRGKARRWWRRCRSSSTPWPAAACTWSPSTTTSRDATRSGWSTLRIPGAVDCIVSTSPTARRVGRRTSATSRLAPTTSLASTTCGTTWPHGQSNSCSASTTSPSWMRWTRC